MNTTPAYIIELEQAFDEGMSSAIPVIVKQVDKERTDIIFKKIENLLRTRQSQGANTYYLNGIREALSLVRSTND